MMLMMHSPATQYQTQKTDILAELGTNDHPDKLFVEIRNLHSDTIEILHLEDLQKHAEEDQQYKQSRNFILYSNSLPTGVNLSIAN